MYAARSGQPHPMLLNEQTPELGMIRKQIEGMEDITAIDEVYLGTVRGTVLPQPVRPQIALLHGGG